MPQARLISKAPNFRRALRAWYRASARPLPWRTSPSLYSTVVSEFMLQQTQVATVLPYFERWLAAFPGFAALAAADESVVLRHWEGLGYYSRARNLHRLARAVAPRPHPPSTPAEWLELPGVGPYTAAAVSSIAQGARIACVDGNVVRVLARLTADASAFNSGSAAATHFSPLASALVPAAAPGDHNQALMELGAAICTPRSPRCGECPVRRFCAAGADGAAEDYPRISKPRTEQQAVTRVWCVKDASVLLYRAPASARRLAGQHELPSATHVGLPETIAQQGPLLARRQRSITRFRITESIHAAPPPAVPLSDDLAWVSVRDLPKITLSGPHRRWINELIAVS